MPYDTSKVLQASRYFLAQAKSACGANAEGGGGFQPGNTCAGKENKGGSVSFKYKEGQLVGDEDPRGLSPEHFAYDPVMQWEQDDASLLKDAVERWKGTPGGLKTQMKKELDGEPEPNSGPTKQIRAQARAILKAVINEGIPAPRLYRGDNKPPSENSSILLGWTSDIAVAKKWAKKYNGKVYTLDGAIGTPIDSVPGVKQPFVEKEWIVPHNVPYDTSKILEASRYFLAQAKSACGANAEGGGGFQPGNTCASSEGSASGSKTKLKPREAKMLEKLKEYAELGEKIEAFEEEENESKKESRNRLKKLTDAEESLGRWIGERIDKCDDGVLSQECERLGISGVLDGW